LKKFAFISSFLCFILFYSFILCSLIPGFFRNISGAKRGDGAGKLFSAIGIAALFSRPIYQEIGCNHNIADKA
jgi:hypothetical protein